MVTGLRAFPGAEPIGECELGRTCAVGDRIQGEQGSDDTEQRRECVLGDDSRSLVAKARDMVIKRGRDGQSRQWDVEVGTGGLAWRGAQGSKRKTLHAP